MKPRVTTVADGKVGLVTLEGEIDFSVVPEMREAIDEAVASGPERLLIDLSAVLFIASDGLGVLIEAQRSADASGRKLDLIKPQGHILDILKTTQLTKLFHIHENIDEAINSLE